MNRLLLLIVVASFATSDLLAATVSPSANCPGRYGRINQILQWWLSPRRSSPPPVVEAPPPPKVVEKPVAKKESTPVTRAYRFEPQTIADLQAKKPISILLSEGDLPGTERTVSQITVKMVDDGGTDKLVAFANNVEIGSFSFVSHRDSRGREYIDMGQVIVHKKFQGNGVNSALFGLMDALHPNAQYINGDFRQTNYEVFAEKLDDLGYKWNTFDHDEMAEALDAAPGGKVRSVYGFKIDPRSIQHSPNARVEFRAYRE